MKRPNLNLDIIAKQTKEIMAQNNELADALIKGIIRDHNAVDMLTRPRYGITTLKGIDPQQDEI